MYLYLFSGQSRDGHSLFSFLRTHTPVINQWPNTHPVPTTSKSHIQHLSTRSMSLKQTHHWDPFRSFSMPSITRYIGRLLGDYLWLLLLKKSISDSLMKSSSNTFCNKNKYWSFEGELRQNVSWMISTECVLKTEVYWIQTKWYLGCVHTAGKSGPNQIWSIICDTGVFVSLCKRQKTHWIWSFQFRFGPFQYVLKSDTYQIHGKETLSESLK